MANQDGAEVGTEAELSVAPWRKSSYSNNGGNCVEVAPLSGGRVAVRDSKNHGGPTLVFTAAEWTAFTAGLIADEFDTA